jgi:catechol 2,3-dioxygenase-like lactoylglutathione lyase family enzyme
MSEFYPMPSFPTLTVGDLAASCAFYEALGFESVFVMPGPGGAPALAHLRWARYADLLLRPGAVDGPKGGGITLTFAVAAIDGIDALAEKARVGGAVILREPGDRPWNARDFSAADPDGYALTFTFGPINRDLDMAAVVANVTRS